MKVNSPAVEMYEKDIEELEKLIGIAIRPNIKRQSTEYKNNLSHLIFNEWREKKIEAEQKKKEEEKKTEATTEKKRYRYRSSKIKFIIYNC